jgi:hypothetical protein
LTAKAVLLIEISGISTGLNGVTNQKTTLVFFIDFTNNKKELL